MNRISRQLLKIAREINALDEEEQKLDIAQKQGKKYILHHKEGNLWRIQACKDFVCQDEKIKKGDFGSLIESEKNLSHDGNCWVYDDAKVFGRAQISEDARVQDTAQVSDDAKVFGRACVVDHAKVYGNACVYGNAYVDNSLVQENAQFFGNAKIYNNAVIYGDAKIYGNAQIWSDVKVNYDVKDKEIK